MNDRSLRRRDVIGWSLAASSGLAPMGAWAAAEPPPEITRIRLSRYPFDVASVAPMASGGGQARAAGPHQGHEHLRAELSGGEVLYE